jgi:hypothetical protein
MTRVDDKKKAQGLRRQGKTYSEIRSIIPNLSKGTLCGWVRNIALTHNQKDLILKKMRTGADSARSIQRQRGSWTNQLRKIERIKQIVTEAKKEVKTLKSDNFFLMGLMLYWAEGDKSVDRQNVKFCNSDPLMVEFMMKWFRQICKVPENKFFIELNIHELLDKEKMLSLWLSVTKISVTRFSVFIKPTQHGSLKNPSYQGTCSIRIHNVDLFRKIVTWRIYVLKEMGFDIKNAPVAQWIEQMFSKH